MTDEQLLNGTMCRQHILEAKGILSFLLDRPVDIDHKFVAYRADRHMDGKYGEVFLSRMDIPDSVLEILIQHYQHVLKAAEEVYAKL